MGKRSFFAPGAIAACYDTSFSAAGPPSKKGRTEQGATSSLSAEAGKPRKPAAITKARGTRTPIESPAVSVANAQGQCRLPKCHPRFNSQCARCIFGKFGPSWRPKHGCLLHKGKGTAMRTVWLQERPRTLPGPWGLGCAICAQLQHVPLAGEGCQTPSPTIPNKVGTLRDSV